MIGQLQQPLLSPRQLDNPDLTDQVSAVLTRLELPPHCLQLELTESMLVADPPQ